MLVLSKVLMLAATSLMLSSPAFRNGASVPHEYAYHGYGCVGRNISPELHWSGVPAGTKSFALTMFDPDARNGLGWWHWVAFDIPVTATRLVKGAGSGTGALMPLGAMQGSNSFQVLGYGGPCPPKGERPHHYVFTLYALDLDRVDARGESTIGADLQRSIRGHVLAKAELVGRFGR